MHETNFCWHKWITVQKQFGLSEQYQSFFGLDVTNTHNWVKRKKEFIEERDSKAMYDIYHKQRKHTWASSTHYIRHVQAVLKGLGYHSNVYYEYIIILLAND